MIQNDFKYQEQFNIIYLRMQAAGIIKKAYDNYLNSDLNRNKYNAKDHYHVELEGVLFEHVKLICLGFSMVIPLVLIVLLIEIVHNWIVKRAMKMKVVPTSEQSFVKNDENLIAEASSQVVLSYPTDPTYDKISFLSTELMMDELMEIIDLEYN